MSSDTTAYVPEPGDFVWLTFDPQAGREQAGRRPALVLSAAAYNRKTGLALFCPVTNQTKGYPFEVQIPEGSVITGVVLADQIRNLDWRARTISYIGAAPSTVVKQATGKIKSLLEGL